MSRFLARSQRRLNCIGRDGVGLREHVSVGSEVRHSLPVITASAKRSSNASATIGSSFVLFVKLLLVEQRVLAVKYCFASLLAQSKAVVDALLMEFREARFLTCLAAAEEMLEDVVSMK